MAEFKPNVMPLMYWALAYGAAAGVILFILWLLSAFITIVWFPVFLAGVVWGAWRNYQQQKKRWYAQAGVAMPQQSPLNEFRQAAADIAASSQDFLNQTEDEAEPAAGLPAGQAGAPDVTPEPIEQPIEQPVEPEQPLAPGQAEELPPPGR